MSDSEAAHAASAQQYLKLDDNSNNAAAVQLSNVPLHGSSHGLEQEETKQVEGSSAAATLPHGP